MNNVSYSWLIIFTICNPLLYCASNKIIKQQTNLHLTDTKFYFFREAWVLIMITEIKETASIKSTLLCVVGLGYVGLPLAVAFGKKQNVIAFDTDEQRINELRLNYDRTLELTSEEISAAEFIHFCHNPNEIADAQIYIVAVPSPIDVHNQPNIKPITSACEMIASVLSQGDIVIF